ncbi:hypothetical protein [Stieleria sp.]|uniref:hypothetical protein n=1 Tax=Stieleria sp. TaxID=2795976 RepID=UPI00356A55D5
MNQSPPPNDLPSGSQGEGDIDEGSRTLSTDSHETVKHAATGAAQFIAWLAIGFAVTLAGALIGLVLYVSFGLEGDERVWGGAVVVVGVFYSLLGAAGWAVVPPIAARVDRRIAFGTVLLGFIAGVLSFSVIW